MRNSTLKAYFNPTGEFTTIVVDNKRGAAGAKISVNYNPDTSKLHTERNWFEKWIHSMRKAIYKDFNQSIIGDLYITNLKYIDEDNKSFNFECDLYKIHPDSDYYDVVQLALEAAHDRFPEHVIDKNAYCDKYVSYFYNERVWGIKLDCIDDMVKSCTKESIYRIKTDSSGLTSVYYNDNKKIGTIEQYGFDDPMYDNKWAVYWMDTQAQSYGQESEQWSCQNLIGYSYEEVVSEMIDDDWKRRAKDLK